MGASIGGTARGSGGAVHGLEHVRAEIDALDGDIVRLLARRQYWVAEAGRLKTDAGAVRAPDRVAAVLERVRALADAAGADPRVVEQTYRAMIEAFIGTELEAHDASRRRGP